MAGGADDYKDIFGSSDSEDGGESEALAARMFASAQQQRTQEEEAAATQPEEQQQLQQQQQNDAAADALDETMGEDEYAALFGEDLGDGDDDDLFGDAADLDLESEKGGGSRGKKHSSKSSKSSSSGGKKHKSSSSDAETAAQQRKRKREERLAGNPMEQALARVRARKQARTQAEVDKVQLVNMAVELRKKMKRAHEQDVSAMAEGRPALAKIAACGEVQKMLIAHPLRDHLTEDVELFECVREWLEPLHKQLPNIKIRTMLLDVMWQYYPRLPLGIIADSRVGNIVKFLSVCPAESVPNRNKAAKLVESWARNEEDTDYKTVTEEKQERDERQGRAGADQWMDKKGQRSRQARRQAGLTSVKKLENRVSASQAAERPTSGYRARIPQQIPLRFERQPASGVVNGQLIDEMEDLRTRSAPTANPGFQKTLGNLKRKSGPVRRGANMKT